MIQWPIKPWSRVGEQLVTIFVRWAFGGARRNRPKLKGSDPLLIQAAALREVPHWEYSSQDFALMEDLLEHQNAPIDLIRFSGLAVGRLLQNS